MKKQRISIEKELRSRSANIIWPLLSTPSGLAKWIADQVEEDQETLTFTWGEVWSHHDTKKAKITETVDFSHIRFVWVEDEDPDAFWELRLHKSDITGDYILQITDYAWKEDMDDLRDIWNQNLEQLHMNTGL